MQVALGKRADYAIRAILELSRHHGQGRRKSREIADATGVPGAYLSRILATLAQAGLVVAVAGPAGGYRLARRPADVSILEVIEMVEGDSSVRECVLRGLSCDLQSLCAVHDFWVDAQAAMNEKLHRATFADVLGREAVTADP